MPAQNHVAFLDGLRALAALWVVLSHMWCCQFGMFAHGGVAGAVTNWLLYSHLAVDLFIVLSGFCLILPVARSGRISVAPLGFYLRRARRILPPFYAALVLSILARVLLQRLSGFPASVPLRAVLTNALLLQDLFLNRNIFNGPFWSIAVEWRIYFLFPVIVWTLMRFGCRATLLWTGCAGYALNFAILHWQPHMFLACPWYLLLFAMGSCAAWAAYAPSFRGDNRPPSWALASALLAAALALLLHRFPVTSRSLVLFGEHMPLIDAVAGAAASSFLIVLARASQRPALALRRVLEGRILAGLGGFAYSLYLIHMPLVLLLNALIVRLALPAPARLATMTLAGLPVVAAAAYLFYLGCEKPFLARRRQKPAESVVDAAGQSAHARDRLPSP